MQCVKIDESLVGCAVEIDLKSGKLEGKVRSVDSTGSKVTIIEGFLLPSKTPLPPIYRVFIKEILKGKLYFFHLSITSPLMLIVFMFCV